MDTNRFKSSHDFSNVQKNMYNRDRVYVNEMKSRNQEASKHDFIGHTHKSAKDVLDEIQKMNSWALDKDRKESEEKK